MEYNKLDEEQQSLVDDYNNSKLARNVDEGNVKHGHGIACTNDFGFQRGENMRISIPFDVQAQLNAAKRGK